MASSESEMATAWQEVTCAGRALCFHQASVLPGVVIDSLMRLEGAKGIRQYLGLTFPV